MQERFEFIKRNAERFGIPAGSIVRIPVASWQFQHKEGGKLSPDTHISIK